ncbi:nucleotidyltransferase domain-containing protein [Tunturibacter empetritectus]|uniref:Nucleotidyltransferase n=1 Tax=Tunturiibacter lichenicola TaxID=2051959 RepID=A0A7W8N493_9BACT|nr:nucleotidyltransferase domain-containing protein [Edaphobacter lichenicola]MBB5343336.1 putative nucleotidyltransferase [Edaphobacter lichenicola]
MIALRSKLRRALLTHYLVNRAASHYVRELAALLHVDPTNLSRELSRLEEEGLFRSELRGNQKYYSLNKKYPLLKEVFTILQRTIGVVPAVSEALRKIPGIQAAYLYGSFAKGEEDTASDIDVLIVGKPEAGELASAAGRLEKLLNREVNYTVIVDQELKRKLAGHDPFLSDIWNGKRVELIAA